MILPATKPPLRQLVNVTVTQEASEQLHGTSHPAAAALHGNTLVGVSAFDMGTGFLQVHPASQGDWSLVVPMSSVIVFSSPHTQHSRPGHD